MNGKRTHAGYAIAIVMACMVAALTCLLGAILLCGASAQAAWASPANLQSPANSRAAGASPTNPQAPVQRVAASAPNATDDARNAMPGVKVRAKLQHDGWQKAVGAGKTAGTTKTQGLRKVKITLSSANGISGSICYKTYTPGTGWSKTAKNGKASGSSKRAITGIKVWLTGQAGKRYDVCYRLHFTDVGWLGWAKGKQAAGTKKTFAYATAIQVKLVEKGASPAGAAATTPRYVKSRWQALEGKYLADAKVRQLLEVKWTGGSKADIVLLQKKGTAWKTALSCTGYVGKAGIGQASMYSTRTPSGDFGITEAFGIKPDPGAKLPYVKVNKYMYWCGDRHYYNQLVDIRKKPHDCEGEHLIDISPYYDYGLFFDYNTNPVKYGAGSAFFVHCTGGQPNTDGCIAMSKANMVKVLKRVQPGTRLLVYKK